MTDWQKEYEADPFQGLVSERYEQFYQGVAMYESGAQCPESAPEAVQRGYGIAYAAAEAKPPIDLGKFDEQFREVFK